MIAKDLKAGHYRDLNGHPYRIDRTDRWVGGVSVIGETMDRLGQVISWSNEWRPYQETDLIPDAAPPKDLQ